MITSIRPATTADAPSIARIYNYYVLNTIVTFEEEVITVEEMSNRIQEVQEKFPWCVYESGGSVTGYAYASSWKSRCAYRYSAEVSVYLDHSISGQGIGTALYTE